MIYKAVALQYVVLALGITWGWAARSCRLVPTCWVVPATLALILLGIAALKLKNRTT